MAKQRTWSAFGSIRRLPSEYEVVTHSTDWTSRAGAAAPLEVNPCSPENLWLRTYREGSPLQVPDWTRFRDPDEMTYRKYVTTQDDAETAIEGILVEFEDGELWERPWADVLLRFFTPLRYLAHGLQMAEIYLMQMAPHSYVKNCGAFASADLLRLNTWVSYRTEMLRRLLPDVGFAEREREIWQTDPAWQGVREAIERLLLAYDFGESFVATNLVLAPALSELLLGIFPEIARTANDDLTWLLLGKLMSDAERRGRWSAATALYAVKERDENAAAIADWAGEWGGVADRAVSGIAREFTHLDPKIPSADDLLARTREVRLCLLPDVVTSRLSAGVR
jgi:toluene monooxygenase system protein E